MEKCKYPFFIVIISQILHSSIVFAQFRNDSTLSAQVSIQQCISFALKNQPAVKQASIDEQINERNIAIGLADWLPQLNTTANAQHYFKLPVSYIQNQYVPTGVQNSSLLSLQTNQVLYNSTVALAARTSQYSREYYKQNALSTQINVVAGVSKAFYDVLLSQHQLLIVNDDIVRLQKSLKDAYNRYQAGIVDKIDYKQATIALNNETAAKKQAEEAIKSKTAFLKQLMGLPTQKALNLVYDSLQLEHEVAIDTNQALNINNRVEYKELQTQKNLDNLNVNYYRWSFLPSVSAFGTYNLSYFNQNLPDLYSHAYPNSLVGLNLSIPIFQGTKRLQNLGKARLQVERADYDLINTRNLINTEYVQALAAYKSSYTDFITLKQNVDLAKDVYNVVSLQYHEGIKTYLNVITAQSDLRTAELNYYNALFNVLTGKIELQKALGTLPVPY